MTFFWLIGKVVRFSPWPITICTDSQTSQSGLNENSCTWHQAPENTCQQITIGFGFTSDWLKKWRDLLDLLPSQSQHAQTVIYTNNNSEKTYEVGVSAKCGIMHMAKLPFARVHPCEFVAKVGARASQPSVWASCLLFECYFWLVDKVAQDFFKPLKKLRHPKPQRKNFLWTFNS